VAHFDGADYVPERDEARLTQQLLRIWELMGDTKWRTLREIATATQDPESSVSAQLRNLRKEQYGRHLINRKYLDKGVFAYQLVKNPEHPHPFKQLI